MSSARSTKTDSNHRSAEVCEYGGDFVGACIYLDAADLRELDVELNDGGRIEYTVDSASQSVMIEPA